MTTVEEPPAAEKAAPAASPPEEHSTSLRDVQQLGLIPAIKSLSYVFWVCGAMEMVERLAYYGVKAVAVLYVTGTLMMVFAFVSSFLPIFTGGLSDRYGYKETIFLSTVVKICGYLVMAWFHSYGGFFLGCMLLAAGTAIFKPGIQGTLVKSTSRKNSSIAWGIFYQTVNIGGWLGPLVAAQMRVLEWQYVFYACACIICLNFLLLLTYREVGIEERKERARQRKSGVVKTESLPRESIRELLKPHVWTYLLLFSGFWFMFMALFDVLPAHIRDWVDTRDIVRTLSASGQVTNEFVKKALGMDPTGSIILPEGLVNINAGLIMITCFLFAFLSGKMRATTSMVVGTLFATVAMFAIGSSAFGWLMVGSIAIFSVGEMLSSPKFSEFIGNFAPSDKKAMYLGFSQIPIAIGWTLEGKVAPMLYGKFSSKDAFSRDMIVERVQAGSASVPDAVTGMAEAEASRVTSLAETHGRSVDQLDSWLQSDPTAFAEAIPQGEGFDWLVTVTADAPRALTDALWNAHSIGTTWYIMMIIGVISAVGIGLYGRWILTLKETD
jgi:dipeptide/tripeptide permease